MYLRAQHILLICCRQCLPFSFNRTIPFVPMIYQTHATVDAWATWMHKKCVEKHEPNVFEKTSVACVMPRLGYATPFNCCATSSISSNWPCVYRSYERTRSVCTGCRELNCQSRRCPALTLKYCFVFSTFDRTSNAATAVVRTCRSSGYFR